MMHVASEHRRGDIVVSISPVCAAHFFICSMCMIDTSHGGRTLITKGYLIRNSLNKNLPWSLANWEPAIR